jgi:hypothetical protein
MRLTYILILAASLGRAALAQQPATAPPNPPSGSTSAQQQSNAASATQDNSGASGDQITKPAGAKEATVIGCLTGPDKNGRYSLHSMSHRFGLQVLGSDELKKDSGSKVKLTGQWQPLPPSDLDKKSPETKRFQATDVEVLAAKCKPPGETPPVSTSKPQKPTTYNAPSTDDSNPK